jgi:hypothetical protein
MIKVFVSPNQVEVESLRNILEQAGIPCTVKNQYNAMLAGGVPFVEVFPEIWVLRDEDVPAAKDIVGHWSKATPVEGSSWRCKQCGENHDKEFTSCWKCGQERS